MTIQEKISQLSKQQKIDMEPFYRYMPQDESYYYYDTMNFIQTRLAYKVLCGYAIRLLITYDPMIWNQKVGAFVKDIYLPKVDLKSLNEECDETIFDFDVEMQESCEKLLIGIGLYEWEVRQYCNQEIMQDYTTNNTEAKATELSELINPYMQEIYDDTNESNGFLDFFVIYNKKLGSYLKYLHKYPDEKINEIDDCIQKTKELLTVPMGFFFMDMHTENISESGIYYSTFAVGYYGGFEDYCNSTNISPGCLVQAYYMEQYLNIAIEAMPGLKEELSRTERKAA